MMMNLMTILVKKVFISSKPTFVYLLCPPLCGPFSIQESAAGGLSYKVKKPSRRILFLRDGNEAIDIIQFSFISVLNNLSFLAQQNLSNNHFYSASTFSDETARIFLWQFLYLFLFLYFQLSLNSLKIILRRCFHYRLVYFFQLIFRCFQSIRNPFQRLTFPYFFYY